MAGIRPEEHVERWAMQGFDGGICTANPAHAIDGDQSPDAENFDPSVRWMLKKRTGTSNFSGDKGVPTGTIVNGLCAFTHDNGTVRMIAKEGTTTHDVAGAAWGSALTGYTPADGDKCYFSMFKNKIIVTSTARPAPLYLDTGTAWTALGGSPPSGIYNCVHKGRLWIANTSADPSRIYYSALNNEADWSSPNDSGNFYVAVSDGMTINGICSDGDVLYISKSASGGSEGAIYAVFGDGPADFRAPRRISWFGAVSQWAFIPTQSFVVAACSTGIYGMQGTQMILLSEAINPDWLALTDAQRAEAAIGRWKNQIWVSYPASGSTNTKAFVLDIPRGRWGRHNPVTARVFATHPDGNLFAGSTSASIRVLKYNTGTSDLSSAAISLYWTTPDIDFGQFFADKRWKQSFVHANSSQSVTWTLEHYLNGTISSDAPTMVANTEGPVKGFNGKFTENFARFLRFKISESSTSASEAYGIMSEAIVYPLTR